MGLFLEQVVHAVSHMPAGASAQSAAAAVRALDPRYAAVTAVDSGKVDVLTRLEKPADLEGDGKGNDRREEEIAHEQLLFGMEVQRRGRWLRGSGACVRRKKYMACPSLFTPRFFLGDTPMIRLPAVCRQPQWCGVACYGSVV